MISHCSGIDKHKKMLFLCADESIKNHYLASDLFRANDRHRIFTDTELIAYLHHRLEGYYICLSMEEKRSILLACIHHIYPPDSDIHRMFIGCAAELVALYDFFFWQCITYTEQQYKEIAAHILPYEAQVFSLYIQYRDYAQDYLIRQYGAKLQTAQKKKRQVGAVGWENISTEAFGFLHDIDYIVIDGMIKRREEIWALVQKGASNFCEIWLPSIRTEYMKDSYLMQYYAEFGAEEAWVQEIPSVESHDPEARNHETMHTGLRVLQQSFLNYSLGLQKEKQYWDDGSVKIVKSFSHQRAELTYIVATMNNLISQNSDGSIEAMQKQLQEIGVFYHDTQSSLPGKLQSVFDTEGVLVRKPQLYLQQVFSQSLDLESVEEIYHGKTALLHGKMRWANGTCLTLEEKELLLSEGFEKIHVTPKKRTLKDMPISAYIIELYRIAVTGLSIQGFERILYSNWGYDLQKSPIPWRYYLTEFRRIAPFFQGQNTLEAWHSTLKNLKAIKKTYKDNVWMQYHPVCHVQESTLCFFDTLLQQLIVAVEKIQQTKGSMQKHMQTLQDILEEKTCSIEKKSVEEECPEEKKQDVIEQIRESIVQQSRQQHSSLWVTEADVYRYVKKLISSTPYIEATCNQPPLQLLVLPASQAQPQQFQTVFIPQAVSGLYPAKDVKRFPQMTRVTEILDTIEEKRSISSASILTQKAFYIQERKKFHDLIGSARKQLIFTIPDTDQPSSYIEEIKACLGISELLPEMISCESESEVCGDQCNYNGGSYLDVPQEKQPAYLTLFCICPKYFYHTVLHTTCYQNRFQLYYYAAGLLFCETLYAFQQQNQQEDRIFHREKADCHNGIRKVFTHIAETYRACFLCFSSKEWMEIRKNARDKLMDWIDYILEHYVKTDTFTVLPPQKTNGERPLPETMQHTGEVYDAHHHVCYKIYSMSYLLLLVQKTGDSKIPKEPHEIFALLTSGKQDLDRIQLSQTLMRQLRDREIGKETSDAIGGAEIWRDTVRYAAEDYNFLKAKKNVGKHCSYCRVRHLCIDGKTVRREETHAD